MQPLASSSHFALLGKALWEVQQVFHNRLEIAWCSSPGGPGNPPSADVEPLHPTEEAEVMLTHGPLPLDLELGSGCLAWRIGKVSRSACKRERRKPDRMRAWQVQCSANSTSSSECLRPGRRFYATQKHFTLLQYISDQKPDCSCRHKEIKTPVSFR